MTTSLDSSTPPVPARPTPASGAVITSATLLCGVLGFFGMQFDSVTTAKAQPAGAQVVTVVGSHSRLRG